MMIDASIIIFITVLGPVFVFIAYGVGCDAKNTSLYGHIGLATWMVFVAWLFVSMLQPLEIDSKKLYRIEYINEIELVVDDNGTIYNLNKLFNKSLNEYSHVYIIKYKQVYCGLYWGLLPSLELQTPEVPSC